MQVGYLPDMFGHVAQMPQILRRFGFADAVVWRGVPAAVDDPGVPLGGARRLLGAGRVPARRLLQRRPSCPPTPTRPGPRSTCSARLQGPRAGDPILLMAGMDHEAPPEHLTDVIAALNAADADPADDTDRPRYHLRIGSLEEYLRGVDRTTCRCSGASCGPGPGPTC